MGLGLAQVLFREFDEVFDGYLDHFHLHRRLQPGDCQIEPHQQTEHLEVLLSQELEEKLCPDGLLVIRNDLRKGMNAGLPRAWMVGMFGKTD